MCARRLLLLLAVSEPNSELNVNMQGLVARGQGEKGVYWYIIGSVTCSSNPDRRGSRAQVGQKGLGRAGQASDRLWWISPATLSNTRWICHFQTYSFTDPTTEQTKCLNSNLLLRYVTLPHSHLQSEWNKKQLKENESLSVRAFDERWTMSKAKSRHLFYSYIHIGKKTLSFFLFVFIQLQKQPYYYTTFIPLLHQKLKNYHSNKWMNKSLQNNKTL